MHAPLLTKDPGLLDKHVWNCWPLAVVDINYSWYDMEYLRQRLGTCSLPAISTPPLRLDSTGVHSKNLRLWPHPCPRKRRVSSLLWRWNSWMVQVYSPLWWFVDAKLNQQKMEESKVEREKQWETDTCLIKGTYIRTGKWFCWGWVDNMRSGQWGRECLAIRDGTQR